MTNTTPNATLEDLPSAEPQAVRLSELRDMMGELAAEEHDALVSGRKVHPVTGFATLDAAIGGGLAPGVHLLSGDPGHGKTALALQIAAGCGYPALYVSAEMSLPYLVRGLIANKTGTHIGNLRDGTLPADEYLRRFDAMAAQCPLLALLDATCRIVEAQAILRCADSLRDGERGRVLVVIDYLQAWASQTAADARSRYDAVNGAVQAAVTIANTLQSPVLAIVARNRSAQRDGGGLRGAADSHTIEYGGHAYYDLVKGDETPDGHEVKLQIQKSRSGGGGKKFMLLFVGAHQRFTEIED